MGTPKRRSQGFLIIVLSLLLVQMLALYIGCKVTIFFLNVANIADRNFNSIQIVYISITLPLILVFVFLLKMAEDVGGIYSAFFCFGRRR